MAISITKKAFLDKVDELAIGLPKKPCRRTTTLAWFFILACQKQERDLREPVIGAEPSGAVSLTWSTGNRETCVFVHSNALSCYMEKDGKAQASESQPCQTLMDVKCFLASIVSHLPQEA